MCHPLRSMSITDTSTLLRGNPPQKRTSVHFCLFRHFRHFPWHSDFCFPRSTNEPVSLSCHLYAARHNAIDRLLHCLSPELSDSDFWHDLKTGLTTPHRMGHFMHLFSPWQNTSKLALPICFNENVGFHPSFSRHGNDWASSSLLIWLNENVHLRSAQ